MLQVAANDKIVLHTPWWVRTGGCATAADRAEDDRRACESRAGGAVRSPSRRRSGSGDAHDGAGSRPLHEIVGAADQFVSGG